MSDSNFVISKKDGKKIKKFVDRTGKVEGGAIGGIFTYAFTPTSLGVVFTVTNNVTGEKLDLTDYGAW